MDSEAMPGETTDHGRKKPVDAATKSSAVLSETSQLSEGPEILRGNPPMEDAGIIPTGSIDLDIALGTGGLPSGRIVEIYGPKSSGKTTLALHAVANAQKNGGTAAYIDTENELDLAYAKNLGVDTDALQFFQPATGEDAIGIVEMLVGYGSLGVIVIDSVDLLVPRMELEEGRANRKGTPTRLMSSLLRRIVGRLSQTKTTAIFVDQLPEETGMLGVGGRDIGNKALKFYSTVRIDVRRVDELREGPDEVVSRIRAKVVKNKMAPPFKQAEFNIKYGHGISREAGLINSGVAQGMLEQYGTRVVFNGDLLGQDKESARKFLADNADVADDLESRIRQDSFPPFGQASASATAPRNAPALISSSALNLQHRSETARTDSMVEKIHKMHARYLVEQGVLEIDRDISDAMLIEEGSKRLAPSWQFKNIHTFQLYPILIEVAPLLGAETSPLGALSWWVTPNQWLAGVEPRSLLGEKRDSEIRFAAEQIQNDNW